MIPLSPVDLAGEGHALDDPADRRVAAWADRIVPKFWVMQGEINGIDTKAVDAAFQPKFGFRQYSS